MSSEVIYHTSDETGAPVLNGVANSLISLLDGFLVNGFNAKSVTSLTVAGGVATATISAHGYRVGRKIQIGGADNVAANGAKKVLSATSNALTFDATGIADGTLTGTITSKSAPLGWTKPFGDATQGIYKRKDVTARAMMLRVIDNGTSLASGAFTGWGMVDSATDMATYTNLVPAVGKGGYNSDGGVVSKADNNSTAARRWFLVGDGTSFYLFLDISTATIYTSGYGFGDVKSYRTDDTTASFIICDPGSTSTFFIVADYLRTNVANHSSFLAHSFDGSASSVPFSFPLVGNDTRMSGTDSAVFPSPYDNGVAVLKDFPIFEYNYAHSVARGSMPGLAIPLSPVAYASGNGAIIQGAAGSGKEYYATMADTTQSRVATGAANFLLDITGPWQ